MKHFYHVSKLHIVHVTSNHAMFYHFTLRVNTLKYQQGITFRVHHFIYWFLLTLLQCNKNFRMCVI